MSKTQELLSTSKYKRFIPSEQRKNGGDGFWLFCDRPFDEAGTDMLRSAIHACKPVPSVLGTVVHPQPS